MKMCSIVARLSLSPVLNIIWSQKNVAYDYEKFGKWFFGVDTVIQWQLQVNKMISLVPLRGAMGEEGKIHLLLNKYAYQH